MAQRRPGVSPIPDAVGRDCSGVDDGVLVEVEMTVVPVARLNEKMRPRAPEAAIQPSDLDVAVYHSSPSRRPHVENERAAWPE